jgi:hypothetical protein
MPVLTREQLSGRRVSLWGIQALPSITIERAPLQPPPDGEHGSILVAVAPDKDVCRPPRSLSGRASKTATPTLREPLISGDYAGVGRPLIA